jgi:hypothetical protein
VTIDYMDVIDVMDIIDVYGCIWMYMDVIDIMDDSVDLVLGKSPIKPAVGQWLLP